jgi:hypothetical protein
MFAQSDPEIFTMGCENGGNSPDAYDDKNNNAPE